MISSIILGIVLLVIGLILKYSQVQRNSLFGYRTYLSMKSEANWAFANKAFARHAIIMGIISLLIGGTSLLLPFNYTYTIFGLLTLLLISIVTIEINLRKFDKKKQS